MKKEELTRSQLLIMKCIWDYGQDIPYLELLEEIRRRYDPRYNRSTMVTFLLQLEEKGYVTTYRKGRFAYVRPVVTEQEFQKRHAKEEVDFWYKGNAACFLSALFSGEKLTKKDEEEIRRLLDELSD